MPIILNLTTMITQVYKTGGKKGLFDNQFTTEKLSEIKTHTNGSAGTAKKPVPSAASNGGASSASNGASNRYIMQNVILSAHRITT